MRQRVPRLRRRLPFACDFARAGKLPAAAGEKNSCHLQDAGAFRQADAAIAVTEAHNNFTPASDAIMQASAFDKLAAFVAVCRGNRTLITIAFTFSIIYNLIGLWFAVQGRLSPMVAAILMPSSTLTIFLITYVGSWVLAKRHRLA